MSEELMPCPWCGEPPEVVEYDGGCFAVACRSHGWTGYDGNGIRTSADVAVYAEARLERDPETGDSRARPPRPSWRRRRQSPRGTAACCASPTSAIPIGLLRSLGGGRMTPETMQKAMRAIGFLEGFSAWVWAHVGEDENLAPEFAGAYDDYVEDLRKAVMSDETKERR